MKNAVDSDAVRDYLSGLQTRICDALAGADGAAEFVDDDWQKPPLEADSGSTPLLRGSGSTRVLADGALFERAGVGFSAVQGDALPPSASVKRPQLAGRGFEALGVSLVLHPHNPYVPTSHANVRFFCADKPGAEPVWWFGGGFDLTPYYPFDDDCVHWHRVARDACRPFGEALYAQFKSACDEYFYLPHRGETRGIGGLFFDDFNSGGFEHGFALMRSVGDAFLNAYLPIVERRRDHPYGERERDFQLYRRGRYVEFNLVYDRGTLFGLQSGGRAESILMSMPPLAAWRYDWRPEPGSPEAELYRRLRPRDWLAGSGQP